MTDNTIDKLKDLVDRGHLCDDADHRLMWDTLRAYLASQSKAQGDVEYEPRLGSNPPVCLSHCYQGEYGNSCKYGYDDCAAALASKPQEPSVPDADKQAALDALKTLDGCLVGAFEDEREAIRAALTVPDFTEKK